MTLCTTVQAYTRECPVNQKFMSPIFTAGCAKNTRLVPNTSTNQWSPRARFIIRRRSTSVCDSNACQPRGIYLTRANQRTNQPTTENAMILRTASRLEIFSLSRKQASRISSLFPWKSNGCIFHSRHAISRLTRTMPRAILSRYVIPYLFSHYAEALYCPMDLTMGCHGAFPPEGRHRATCVTRWTWRS